MCSYDGATGIQSNFVDALESSFGVRYEYPVLIGDLSGVDMLLGMDWLVDV